MVAEVVKVESEVERKRNAGIDKILDDLLARVEGEKAAAAVKTKQKAATGG